MLNSIIKIFSFDFFKLSSISLLGKIIGFIKITFLIRFFTDTNLTDSVFILLAILWFWCSDLIYTLFSNSLIPKISQLKSDKIRFKELIKMMSGINFIMFIVVLSIIIYPDFIIDIFSPSGDTNTKFYLKKLIIFSIPLFILMPITEIFTLFNQYKKKYIISSTNLLISNLLQLIIIILIYFFLEKNKFAFYFSFSFIISYLINSFNQIYFSGFLKYYELKKIFLISFSNFKYYFIRNKSFFISIFIFQSIIYVNLILLSYLEDGSITVYNSVVRISDIFQSIITSKLVIIFFNQISKKPNSIYNELLKYFKPILLITIILGLFFNFFGKEILLIIYGKHHYESYPNIIHLLIFSSFNIYLIAKQSFLIKSIIVKNMSKVLLISSICFIVIVISINYLFLINNGILIIIYSQIISNFIITFYLQYKLFNKLKFKLILLDILYIFSIISINLILV